MYGKNSDNINGSWKFNGKVKKIKIKCKIIIIDWLMYNLFFLIPKDL